MISLSNIPDFAVASGIENILSELRELVEFKEFILQDEKLKKEYAEFKTFKLLQKDING